MRRQAGLPHTIRAQRVSLKYRASSNYSKPSPVATKRDASGLLEIATGTSVKSLHAKAILLAVIRQASSLTLWRDPWSSRGADPDLGRVDGDGLVP